GQPRLGDLCRALLAAVPALPRLRLSSLDPAAIDDGLFGLLATEPRLMPHLHLSVQSGADLILKRMKRRHLRRDVIAVAERARALRPDVVLGADLIAGFPTETEAQHRDTLALIEEAGLTWLHVFPYSARPGTPAARMPQLPIPLRKERAAALRAAGARQVERFLAGQVGRRVAVLLERDGFGHSEGFAPVAIAGAAGEIRSGRVTACNDGRLEAA
ncbi:MAG TPA: radical SAM protein, partial [Kiloniellales bacterium]|nr:radical SAM protein [Kiloniellales bacterium]